MLNQDPSGMMESLELQLHDFGMNCHMNWNSNISYTIQKWCKTLINKQTFTMFD